MTSLQLTPVLIAHRTDSSVSYRSSLESKEMTMSERISGAVGGLLICWVAAVIFIAVPVLHFFLVPTALLGGVAVFISKIQLRHQRGAANVKCPACGATVPLKKAAFNWPIRETCDTCRVALTIECW